MILQSPTISGSVELTGPLEIIGGISASYFEGNGAGLTGLTATIEGTVTFDNVTSKPTLISSSAQIPLVDSSSVATSASFATTSSFASTISADITSSITTKITNLNTNSGSLNFWQGSQAEYDLISASADPNTVYFVK